MTTLQEASATLRDLAMSYTGAGVAYALYWTLAHDPDLDDTDTNLAFHIADHLDVSILDDPDVEFPFPDRVEPDPRPRARSTPIVLLTFDDGCLQDVSVNRRDISVLTLTRSCSSSLTLEAQRTWTDPDLINDLSADLEGRPRPKRTIMVHVSGGVAEVDNSTVPQGVEVDIRDHDNERR